MTDWGKGSKGGFEVPVMEGSCQLWPSHKVKGAVEKGFKSGRRLSATLEQYATVPTANYLGAYRPT